jgi:ketosteroid isomerase-like protein
MQPSSDTKGADATCDEKSLLHRTLNRLTLCHVETRLRPTNGGCAMFNHAFNSIARLLVMIALGLALTAPARAASDQDDIKTVIESQLNAFAKDDGAQAFTFAAPIVKQFFKTPEQFMAMVKKGYQPVYRNQNRIFGEVFQDGLGRPAMRVVLTGADGKRYEALYAMEKQADGTWKIASCTILAIPAQEV